MSVSGAASQDLAPATGGVPSGEQISAIVFDLDGTLYLAAPVQRAMLWRMLRACVGSPVSTWRQMRIIYHYRRAQEHLRNSPDPLAGDQVRLAGEWSGARPDEVRDAVCRWMEEEPLELLSRSLRPGLIDMLEAAKNRGIRIGLLSDYPAKKKLLAMGLDGYFSATLDAQDARVGVFKPSPKGLGLILQDLCVEPARAVYVGDRASVDGEAAYRAGVGCVILGKPLGCSGRGWVGMPDIPSLRGLLAI